MCFCRFILHERLSERLTTLPQRQREVTIETDLNKIYNDDTFCYIVVTFSNARVQFSKTQGSRRPNVSTVSTEAFFFKSSFQFPDSLFLIFMLQNMFIIIKDVRL